MRGSTQTTSSRLWHLLRAVPVVGTPPITVTVIAVVFFMGAAVGTAAALTAADNQTQRTLWASTLLAATTAIGCLSFGRRHPRAAVHGGAIVGLLNASLAIPLYPSDVSAVAVCACVLLVSLMPLFSSWLVTAMYFAGSSAIILAALLTRGPLMLAPSLILIALGGILTVILGAMVRLASNSLVDGLTGLMNRRRFEAVIDDARNQETEQSPLTFLILCDVDHLKAINEVQGEAAGDLILREVAHAAVSVADPGAVVARLGGDEFAIAIQASDEGAHALIRRLRDAVPDVSLSIGLTGWRAGEQLAIAMRRADAALAAAKRKGRGSTVYQGGSHMQLAGALHDALHSGGVTVQFQPLVSLTHGSNVVGVEALARWQSSDGSWVPPDDFIAVAEEEGLIADLGRCVLRQAAQDMVLLTARSGMDVTLFVNTSGRELLDERYVDDVLNILDQTGLEPHRLVIEVTESIVDVDASHTVHMLQQLRQHGIRIAIDDFGTGYSSLSRLHTLPVDYLKLDRSFVSEMTKSPYSPLLSIIAAMGQALRLPIVAEGVEHADQANVLRDMGYVLAQGWLFYQAMTLDELQQRLMDDGSGVDHLIEVTKRNADAYTLPQPAPAAGQTQQHMKSEPGPR